MKELKIVIYLLVAIKVETNGSGGAKNVLTAKEIVECQGIIVATDKNVEMTRFNGKPVIQVKVNPNSHYVAIFEVNGTSVIAGDPATGELITLNNSKYPIATQSLTTQVELFTVER